MRIAVLWTHLSGYMNASLRALASNHGVELYVCNQAASTTAPFAESRFDWIDRRYEYAARPDLDRLTREMNAFSPDIILASWHVKPFQRCCARLRGRAARVACADNPWRGTPRQRLAAATAPLHLRRFFDAAFVPGERQTEWARRMGFDQSSIWQGLYAADVAAFAAPASAADLDPTGFLFAGRLSPEKGLVTLAAAYQGYAAAVGATGETPWICSIAGTGPLEPLLSHPGFLKLGFVQPEALPEHFARAACFVLPSLSENWGVVLQEAAAASLPIICTRECGASIHLVADNYNGYIVDAASVDQLQAALIRMHRLSTQRRRQMGEAGRLLALQFTPERWATTILEMGAELHRRLQPLLGIASQA